jgi:cellulose synthase/poly-beta-1,6-N-acetylglucosamine synthase-like glycosyltransferase
VLTTLPVNWLPITLINTNQPVLLFVDIVLLAIAILLAVPIAVLFVECSAAFFTRREERGETEAPLPKVSVLVPAHNEELGIGATLETLLPQLTNKEQVVVIADNCSDKTAEIARRAGATVIERHDTKRRGKGYALDKGLRFLEANPPDVVVVVDADCIVHNGAIDQIARMAARRARPVQATYLMERPANPGPKDSVSALAFLVKNLVRLAGLERLGLPCLLTGTGMAFPWSAIANAELASGNIVEDMQLALDLAIAGYPPVFCQEARVTGCLPRQENAAKQQRTRWEHGQLQTQLTQVPRLLKAFVQQKRFDLLALALDMCIPPLSLLVMIWAAVTAVALLSGSWGASWTPAMILAIEGFLVLVSIVGAWGKFGRAELPAKALLSVPFYILWKIPLYLAFLVRPQTKWIRTERDAADAPKS